MRPRVQASSVNEGIGIKYILAVVAFFALGFAGVMTAPKLLALRPTAPVTAPAPVAEPEPPAPIAAAPQIAPRPAQKSFSAVETPVGGVEAVRTDGTLAALAACRGAFESGKGYDGVKLERFAQFVGGKVGALTPAQVKQGCKALTEGEPAALALRTKR